MTRKIDFPLFEILVNIWRFSHQHTFHSSYRKCHCSFHIKKRMIEAQINWNEKDFGEINKIIDHNQEFKEVFKSVIKPKKRIASIYDLIKIFFLDKKWNLY